MTFIGLCINMVNTICALRLNHSDSNTLRVVLGPIAYCSPLHRVNSISMTMLVKAVEAQLMLKCHFTEELSAEVEGQRSS